MKNTFFKLTPLLFTLFLLLGKAEAAQSVFLDPSAGSCTDVAPTNTGNGTCAISNLSAFNPTETFTFTATTAGSGANFTVSGSVSGSLGTIIAGVSSAVVDSFGFPRFTVTLSNGGTPYAIGDNFNFIATAGTALTQANFNLLTLTQICANGCVSNSNRLLQSSSSTIIEAAAITASRALASDANGIPVAATTTTTELNYLSGTTSAVQTQINNVYDPTSYSDVNATLLGFKEYNHGTTYNGGIAPTVTSSVSGLTVDKGSFYPYKSQGGSWFMRIEVQGTYTANSHSLANLTINGVTFANEGSNGWALSFAQGNSSSITTIYCLAVRNNSILQYQLGTAISGLTFAITGWAKLSAKPTWAY